MANPHNLFISHSWTYNTENEGLIKLLNERPYFSYKNYSIPKCDPIHYASNDRELYEAIKRKMSPCSVILVLAGVYSTYSKWIDHELNIARNGFYTRKNVIAIEPWASSRTSSKVKNSADRIVKWQSKSIVDAIRDLS